MKHIQKFESYSTVENAKKVNEEFDFSIKKKNQEEKKTM
jgi:hypothetical protein